MAYATGSASSCANVLQSLATFCTSYGWTVDNNAAYSGGWWLAIHKGTCYLNFQVPSGDGLIYVSGATGFSSSSAPNAQANSSNQFACNPGQTASGVNPGPYVAYHFFSSTSGTYLHCVIEVTSNVFAHFHTGQLNTVGGASPAIYVSPSNWIRYSPSSPSDNYPSDPDTSYNVKPFCSNYNASVANNAAVACTVDSSFRWFPFYGGTSPGRMGALGDDYFQAGNWSVSAEHRSPNTFNGVAVLTPITFFVERAAGNIYSLIGEAPDVRFVNMKNNNAKDEITLGSDVWKLFPIIANNPTINVGGAAVSSYPYGLAFKKSA